MTLLDAYALVAFLANESAADEVEALFRRGSCAVSLVNLAEAADVLARVHAIGLEEIRPPIDMLLESSQLELLAPTAAVAWEAAAIRQAHYRQRTCEVSLADCFLIATAGEQDEIATADSQVAAVARGRNRRVVALPNTSGKRP